MKKSFNLIPIFIMCFIMLNINKAQVIENRIKGGFRKCDVFIYKYKFGKVNLNSRTKCAKYKFDDKGNKIDVVFFNQKGTIGNKDIYKYDDKCNELEYISYDSKGKIEFKSESKYNEDGNRIEQTNYKSDGELSSKKTFKYNEKGDLIEYVYYYPPYREESKYEYKYDENGNIIERIKFETSPISNAQSKNISKFNNGKIIEESSNTESGDMLTKDVYLYDEVGNNIEKVNYDFDGNKTSEYICKYNENGNLVEEIHNICITGKMIYKYSKKYDQIGNMIEYLLFDESDEPTNKFEYIYSK